MDFFNFKFKLEQTIGFDWQLRVCMCVVKWLYKINKISNSVGLRDRGVGTELLVVFR